MSRVPVSNVHLNVEVAGSGRTLLLLHGFTGSSATWTPHVRRWRDIRTIAVDLLGHGASDAPPAASRYAFEPTVTDLVCLLDALDAPRTAVLGYSMGGRVALHLALHLTQHAPERLTGLIVESASPGLEDDAERQARAEKDDALADSIERNGVDAFVDRWEQLPLFATQARAPAAVRDELRRQRLRSTATGLANSLRGLTVGRQQPLRGPLSAITVPVLFVAGALDETYTAYANQMAARLPNARLEIVPEAGHAVHLEQPSVFARLVQDFLDESADGAAAGARS
jgi:2-succinyl-6-hydroxy-2,4-cyclohexadiene-1-carboxylate synthase